MQGGGYAARVAISNPCIPTLNPPRQLWPNQAAGESGDTFTISGRVGVHGRRIGCGAQQCERAGMGLGIILVHLGSLPTVPGAPKSPLANTRGVTSPARPEIEHRNRPEGQTSTPPRPQHAPVVCCKGCGSYGGVRTRGGAPVAETSQVYIQESIRQREPCGQEGCELKPRRHYVKEGHSRSPGTLLKG